MGSLVVGPRALSALSLVKAVTLPRSNSFLQHLWSVSCVPTSAS